MFCGNITPVCGSFIHSLWYIAHSLGFIIRNMCFDKLYFMLLLKTCFIKVSGFYPISIKFDVGVNNGWIN